MTAKKSSCCSSLTRLLNVYIPAKQYYYLPVVSFSDIRLMHIQCLSHISKQFRSWVTVKLVYLVTTISISVSISSFPTSRFLIPHSWFYYNPDRLPTIHRTIIIPNACARGKLNHTDRHSKFWVLVLAYIPMHA